MKKLVKGKLGKLLGPDAGHIGFPTQFYTKSDGKILNFLYIETEWLLLI